MITREFNLYLHAGHSIPLVINANQYDRGEQWLFKLFNSDGTQYVPSSGAIVGIKSDNLGIINSGTVDSQGRVVISETQQMTASVGKAVFELVIDDGTHGTANFVVLVEEKPGNNADLSETDISMIEQAIEAASSIKPYGSPLVASTVAGMTDHEKVYVYVGSETGYTSGNWYYWDGSAWASGGVYNSVAVQTDTTLTLSGVAADAKKTGDEISDLKSQITQLEAIPRSVKLAMDTLFQNMAVKDDAVYSDEYAVIHAWATSVNVVSINAVYTPSGTVYEGDSVEDLRNDLIVTATMDDDTTAVVTTYTLSGELVKGTSTVTVTYEGVSTSFTVTVAEYAWTYTSDMGLLSAQDFVTSFDKTNLSVLNEVATSDGLNLSYTGSSAINGKSASYSFTPNTFLNEAVLKFSIKLHALMYNNTDATTANGVLHFRISNGTEGATISFSRYGTATASPKIRYKVGDSFIWGSDISLDTWHDIEVSIRNGKQTIKVDGQVEAENVNLSTTYTTANKLIIFGAAQSLDISLDNIKFGWQ